MTSIHAIQCVSSLDPNDGGPPRSVTGLAGALVRHAPTSVLAPVHAGSSHVPLPDGVAWLNPSGRDRSQLSQRQAISDLLKSASSASHASIIHSHGIWLPFDHAVATASRKLQLTHVVSPRGMLEPWALAHRKWKKRLAWWLFQRSDLQAATALHATAESEAENLRRLGLKQPIAVIPNGIVLPDVAVLRSSFMVPSASLKERSRLENQEPRTKNHEPRTKNQEQTKKTALFLSRLHPKKGLMDLLDAWATIKPVDWRLVIAGNDDGGYAAQLKARVAQDGLAGSVEIVGPLFDQAKETAFREADLFVLPSYSENFGIVVAEALSFGVPVLTTTGCPWEELEMERAGWWVPPGAESVCKALRQILALPSGELREMGLRGRSLVEGHYQWPAIGEKMFRFYSWLLDGGDKPDFVY